MLKSLLGAVLAAALAVHATPGRAQPFEVADLDAVAAATVGVQAPGLSIAVVLDGRVIASVAQGEAVAGGAPVTPDTVFRLASVTKTFTAATVLQLAAEGQLSLSDPLSVHVPELAQADRVTLAQLLNHTGGLPEFTEAADYDAHRPRDHRPDEMIAWIATLEPELTFEPGTAWAYNNSGYVLLGVVIERVTGLPLERAYAEVLGLDGGPTPAWALAAGRPAAEGYRGRRGDWSPAPEISMTIPGGAGALVGTAAETALALDALFAGEALAPAAREALMATGLLADGRSTRWGMPEAWREGLRADYGPGVFRDEFEGRVRYWHSGDIFGFTTWFAHLPDERLTVVILSNGDEVALPTDDALRAALAAAGPLGQ